MRNAAADLILVVDDQANHRKVLKGFLESHGWRVVLAKDAAEAKKALRQKPAYNVPLPGCFSPRNCNGKTTARSRHRPAG